MSSPRVRKTISWIMSALCGAAVLFALVPLAFILFFAVTRGVQALNVEFFTHMPRPVGEPGGGMANAIVGTLMLTGLGALIAVPVGVAKGIVRTGRGGL